MEFLGFSFLVLGLIGFNLLRKHLRETKQVQLLTILHQHRLKAHEGQVPLSDLDETSLVTQFFEQGGSGPADNGHRLKLTILWVRIVALCLGLAAFLGGIATSAGMYLVNDPNMSNYWSMGLIPTLIGLGLLVFYGLSRSLADQVPGKE